MDLKTKSIKVLHVGSSHLMGLTNQETQLALAYRSLDAVDIVVLSGENEQYSGCFDALADAGIPCVKLKGFDLHRHFLRLVRGFNEIVKQYNPDIVTVNTNWQLAIVGVGRIILQGRFKTIYTIHGFRHNQFLKSFIARFLIVILLWLFADAINAPSSYVFKKFSLLRYKMISIPLGEDDLFFKKSERPKFDQSWVFCFPGQFRAGKNQAMLVEAFSEYIIRTKDTRAMLILPGEGELLEASRSLAIKLGVMGQVNFPGQLDRSDMADLYRKCQFVIIPTNSETFGHCIAEPMVMRRVVLSRPVGIARDVIVHGVNGFLFSTKDELVELMIAIRATTKKELISISDQAGNAARLFAWPEVARCYFNLMKKLLLIMD